MKNSLLFLSGLPRSGSTLLGAVLNQHPDIHVTPTSPLSDLLCLIDENFSRLDIQYTYDKVNLTRNTYSSILENFYSHIPKKYVIDKHRAWPRNVNSVKKFSGKEPKIICTNRRISEIITSYITLIERNDQQDNFVDNYLRSIGKKITLDNRVECLWRTYISDPYESTVFGLNNFRNNIHLLDYNDLTNNPQKELEKIYNFLEIKSFDHDLDNILNTCAEEKDAAWGLENLHNIRSKLGRTNRPPEEVIGIENTLLYDRFNL
jgi:sulfotransferase